MNLLQLRRDSLRDYEALEKEIDGWVVAGYDRLTALRVAEKADAEQVIEVYLPISLHLISIILLNHSGMSSSPAPDGPQPQSDNG